MPSEHLFKTAFEDRFRVAHCPDPLLLEAYRCSQLSPEENHEVQQHLQSCPLCQQALMALSNDVTFQAPPMPAALTLSPDKTQLTAPEQLKAGQIWSSLDSLDLAEQQLAQSGLVSASLQRLFAIATLGPRRLGRYQELQVIPLSDALSLASAEDLFLQPQDTPFHEPLILECWNIQSALANHLGQYYGVLSETALSELQNYLRGQELPAHKRGGRIIFDQSPHAQFQHLERQAVAYLAAPLEALGRLESLSQTFLLKISPKGFQAPQNTVSAPDFFAQLSSGNAPDTVLAASSQALTSEPKPLERQERLELTPHISLDIWLDGGRLEFCATTLEQEPVTGMEIYFSNAEGDLDQVQTDTLGTAFLTATSLYSGQSLLSFEAPARGIHCLYPIYWQP